MVRINRVTPRPATTAPPPWSAGAGSAKDSARIEAYGTVDELNATIGVVRVASRARRPASARTILRRVQNELFNLGAELATPDAERRKRQPSLAPRHVEALEHEIDELNDAAARAPQLHPAGGGPVAAALHVARTVCRRAERRVIGLGRAESLPDEALHYLIVSPTRCSSSPAGRRSPTEPRAPVGTRKN